MKNFFLSGGVLFLVVAGGIGAYTVMNSNQGNPVAETSETTIGKNNQYVLFSPDMMNNSSTTRRVLFFYANWCPTCKSADGTLTQNMAQIPSDVTVIRVNYNDTETDPAEKELAKKYGVTYQHTFVQIDDQGTEVTKWNGGEIKELLSNIK